jgi:hypothetical protein
MKTLQEVIDLVNSSSLSSPYLSDTLIDLTDIQEIAIVNRDEHRWYVLGTVVYKYSN